jgi:hypothetical protein
LVAEALTNPALIVTFMVARGHHPLDPLNTIALGLRCYWREEGQISIDADSKFHGRPWRREIHLRVGCIV